MVGDEDDSKCLAKNGLVLSRGTGRARTSRPSASRQVVAERSPNNGSWCARTAQLRVITRLPIARAGCKCSFLAPGARWQGLEARPKGKSSPQSSRRGRWAGSIELPHTWSGGTSGLAARSPTDACLLSKPTRLHRRVVCQRHAGTPTSRARSAVIGVETA